MFFVFWLGGLSTGWLIWRGSRRLAEVDREARCCGRCSSPERGERETASVQIPQRRIRPITEHPNFSKFADQWDFEKGDWKESASALLKKIKTFEDLPTVEFWLGGVPSPVLRELGLDWVHWSAGGPAGRVFLLNRALSAWASRLVDDSAEPGAGRRELETRKAMSDAALDATQSAQA